MRRINTHKISLAVVFAIFYCRLYAASPMPTGDSTKPNIVFIMVDDGRYDEYRNTGAPEWFVAPSIERIANEGVNFTRTYAATPICGPSRASIYTGVYSHQHGVIDNGMMYNTELPTVQEVLKDNGYYTGFIGKYGNGFLAPTEFNYWVDIGDEELYKSTWVKVNGVNVFIPGHLTDAFNTYINIFFDSAAAHSDQPFALFYFPLAPHPPNTPRTIDAHLFDMMTIDLPENFYPYDSLYPEFYYEGTSNWLKNDNQTRDFIRDRYECLVGVDDNVENIFGHTDAMGVTDSTFIVFTSDNGYIIGEHKMRAKAYALEESIHVPLFVRYPAWFPDSAVIDNDIVDLIDIPATLLKVAGIPDTFGFEGLPLDQLAAPDTMRRFMRYEYGGSTDEAHDVPDLRGVRSFNHLYVYSSCDCYTEELYDFTIDPSQNINQVLSPQYSTLVEYYKQMIDSMMIAVADTEAFMIRDCGLVGAYEIPDELDNDCNGMVDDAITYYTQYADIDGDGYGDASTEITTWYMLSGHVLNQLDCADDLSHINPLKEETCDGIDNNCNGLTDDTDSMVVGRTIWYADLDNDNFGDVLNHVYACNQPPSFVPSYGDCNDGDSTINNGLVEICNGFDDDCNGLTDNDDPFITGQLVFYADNDIDGFGNALSIVMSCALHETISPDSTDCDDDNSLINLVSPEICDGVDNNCDGLLDDADSLISGQSIWYADTDGDGYGNNLVSILSCFLPFGYVADNTDCNDLLATIHPGAYDICDGINNDCDSLIDEDIITPFISASGPLTFCSGSFVTFTASPVVPGVTIQWYKGAVAMAGANGVSFNANKSGNYKVKYTGPLGCVTESSTLTVIVNSNPKPTITNTSASNDLCINSPVKLSTKNKVGHSYQWYKGATALFGATTNKYNATFTGNYKVKQTDENGCTGTSPVFAVVSLCKDMSEIYNGSPEIVIYPNPAGENFTISVTTNSNLSGTAYISLVNLLGAVQYEEEAELDAGRMEQTITLPPGISKGMYIVHVEIGHFSLYKQLMVN